MKTGNKLNVFVLILIFNFLSAVYAHAEIVDRIVAIVDEDIITLVQLENETDAYRKKIEAAGYPEEKKQEMIQEVNTQILNSLIDASLTRQEARKYNIDISEQDVTKAVENFRSNRSLSQEEFEQGLEKEGLSIEDFRDNMKNQIIQGRIINYAVRSKVVVTEKEIEQYYNDNIQLFSGQKKYHLRNILKADENALNEVKIKLDMNQDFAQLAREYSEAPNAGDGGDLGLFDINNFSETIKEKISLLEKGDHTDVIQTGKGFQIFFVEDIVVAGQKTPEEARETIHKTLNQEKMEAKFKTWLESLKEKAHIKIML